MTKFVHYSWNSLKRGQTVEVTLSTGANVRLMDSANFNAYRVGRNHRYHGGLVNRSPYRLVVPRDGNWHLTIDLNGLRASSLRHSARVLPSTLPVARSAATQRPLNEIIHERPPVDMTATGESWDVFISHASEDKAAVAEPLAEALRAKGLRVWLDKTELRIGDSLRRKIDRGLASSTFGVVVLSKSFFAKGWPQYELDGIVSRSVDGSQRMLPIWHEISRDEIARQAPSLVDKVARDTTSSTVQEIADEIAEVVSEQ